ncbi:hypothetical protein MMUC44124_00970 [Mycolicibacterium mucogenicum DSM 44124]|uniref:Uncharacterized protein n=1 Tax=Mycolicibacterium mucogenicum DSM 44124 TaxID=1226753 RepID=A0A8H2PF88_MYCMU|nr:hypothetical protein MMUC44124_00970 [Mycolicibacterium mucogenicum DSM 44124]
MGWGSAVSELPEPLVPLDLRRVAAVAYGLPVRERQPAEARCVDDRAPYVAERADGARAEFSELGAAKRFCQEGDLGGTVRYGRGRGAAAEHRSEHLCLGCGGLVSGEWMAWTDRGEWLCRDCRNRASGATV